ncbi:MAG: glycosyltransferase [bacterium]|nr:glycosyltransferase [bacterium]
MESRTLKVAVVVLNWNGVEVLPLCLESLSRAAAASRHDMDLMVVDNNSTDGSCELLAEQYPDWELLRSSANLGFAGGMNLGIREYLERDVDYICVVNNDIEADSGLFDPLLIDLETEARRGAACPRMHYFEPRERIWYGGGKVGRLTLVSRHLGIRKKAQGRWLQAADTGYLTGCCLMGRTEFWRTTEGFDEEFGFYSEDVDLSLRASGLGWTLRYVPAGLLYHKVGYSSGGGGTARKLRAQRIAVGALVRRHRHPALQPIAWAGWSLFACRGALAAILRGEGGIVMSLFKSILPWGKRGSGP